MPRRAVGLDTYLVVDYADGALRDGDLFLLVSDGVWEVLGEAVLREVVGGTADPQAIAGHLVRESLARQARYMGRNDATSVAVRVAAAAGDRDAARRLLDAIRREDPELDWLDELESLLD